MNFEQLWQQLATPNNLWLTVSFFGVFLAVLSFDLFMHRKHQHMSVGHALKWTGFYMGISVLFTGVVYYFKGHEGAVSYLTGWALESTMSTDNMLVFIAIFSAFGINRGQDAIQHKVLTWGILGCVIIRFISLGFLGILVNLPSPMHEIVAISLALIVGYSGYKMLKKKEDEVIDYPNHGAVRFFKKFLAVEPSLADGKFFVRIPGVGLAMTVTFMALLVVEGVDVVFAVDSMTAIAAACKDPFIMLPASMMAVLGLRSLYFVLVEVGNKMCHLEKAIICLLFWVAAKMVLDAFHIVEVPALVNLGIIGGAIAVGIVASLIFPEKEEKDEEHAHPAVESSKPAQVQIPTSASANAKA